MRYDLKFFSLPIFFPIACLFLFYTWALKASPKSIEQIISFIASDECKGRKYPSAGHLKAKEYLVDQLEKLGVEPAVETKTGRSYIQKFPHGENILGTLGNSK